MQKAVQLTNIREQPNGQARDDEVSNANENIL